MKPTKAIIAVAGYGTRRLPVAKAIEKCMLPILNRPVVDYIVEDCVKAGVTDIYFVVSGEADQLRKYYSRNYELEAYLQAKNKSDIIAAILPPSQVRFHYIVQDRYDNRYGTSVPVWLVRDYIASDESFFVIMGDNCLWSGGEESELAILAQKTSESHAAAGMIGVRVDPALVSLYGAIDLDSAQRFRGIVEKPALGTAPSNLINPSMYLFPGQFMEYIEAQMQRAQQTEYLITEAINQFAAAGNDVVVYASDAKYLDSGTLEHWVEANRWLLDKTKHN